MTKTRKLLLSLMVVGVAASVVAVGVFSAFSSTTSNAGNSLTAGTVAIGDNDAGAAMFNNVTGGKPGTSVQRCITVTYTGSLDADVRLYTTDASSGALAQYVDVTIEPGSFSGAPPAFPGCTGFTADSGGSLYSGTLSNFRTAHGSYANGVVDNPGSALKWITNDSVVYRFTYSVQDTNSAQGLATGSHSYTWEARNQ